MKMLPGMHVAIESAKVLTEQGEIRHNNMRDFRGELRGSTEFFPTPSGHHHFQRVQEFQHNPSDVYNYGFVVRHPETGRMLVLQYYSRENAWSFRGYFVGKTQIKNQVGKDAVYPSIKPLEHLIDGPYDRRDHDELLRMFATDGTLEKLAGKMPGRLYYGDTTNNLGSLRSGEDYSVRSGGSVSSQGGRLVHTIQASQSGSKSDPREFNKRFAGIDASIKGTTFWESFAKSGFHPKVEEINGSLRLIPATYNIESLQKLSKIIR